MSTTAVISVAFASLGLLPAQTARVEDPLSALSGTIRSLTNRVSPAVVELQVTGYSAT